MTVLLLRHGRSVANAQGILAGRTRGVALDTQGCAQATALIERCADLPLQAIVSSPAQRCLETITPLATQRGLCPLEEPALHEVDYGQWSGKAISDLYNHDIWKQLQTTPSAVTFPGGESLAEAAHRSIAFIKKYDSYLMSQYGENTLWLACTHGDIIKSLIADAYGMHQDLFQRIMVLPASISIIRYDTIHPYILSVNTTDHIMSSLIAQHPPAVGGGDHAKMHTSLPADYNSPLTEHTNRKICDQENNAQ